MIISGDRYLYLFWCWSLTCTLLTYNACKHCPCISWDKCSRVHDCTFKVERRGKRPWGHPGTGRARPPRCLVRWQCNSPRSLITSRRSAGRDLGRNSAVSLAVSEPFLSRFSTQMDKKLGFEGQKRLKDHRQRHNRWLQPVSYTHLTLPTNREV